jgi:hypothetical protein
MPRANAEAMQKYLEEISQLIAAKAHGVVIMDRAGWHKSGALKIPENLSILFLPPYSPELSPTENIWQFLRQTVSDALVPPMWGSSMAAADRCTFVCAH